MRLFNIKLILLLAALVGVTSEQVQSQSHEQGVPYQMEKIYGQLEDSFMDLPAGVRRVAVYKMNYNSLRFTEQEIDFIRGKMESGFREFGGLTVLSPLELEPNDKMKIMGTDSSLQIMNIQGRSIADITPELLSTITQKYGVQGLVELGIQRTYPEGLVITARMMNPNSREIVWTKSFIANPFKVKEEIDLGQRFVITIGAGGNQGESIVSSDTTLSGLNAVVASFNGSFTFRQSLNPDNSSYLGFTGGVNVLKSTKQPSFDLTLVELGVTYYQSISQKNESINDYRMMFFTNANVQFTSGASGQIFSVKPGLMLNLTQNLGLSFYSSMIISGETLTLDNNDEITYNKLGYGLHAVIRF